MSREKKVAPMKLAVGSIRRRGKNGCFAYRCQVNGRRTEISLQTKDYHEALKKVADLVPSAQAQTARKKYLSTHKSARHGKANLKKSTVQSILSDIDSKTTNNEVKNEKNRFSQIDCSVRHGIPFRMPLPAVHNHL